MKRTTRQWYGGLIGTALAVILPALPAGLGVGHASGRYVPALVISLAISAATYALFSLDLVFIHPLFRDLSPSRAV